MMGAFSLRATVFGASLAIAASAQVAAAQQVSPLALGVEASTARVVRDVATTQILGGPVLGASVRGSWRRFELEGQYLEGSLTPEGAAGADGEDFVDARAVARVRVMPWLSLGAGPHLRAFITPSGTARWSRIELHARGEGELIAGLAQLRVDTWFAVSAESNVQDGGDGAMGGEVGLLLRIPRTPAALQLSYVADRAMFTNGGSEFVEGVRAGIVLDRILRARGQ